MIINDLTHTEGNLMDWVSAKLKFELADQEMVGWLSIVQAIPSTWKKQISNYGRRIDGKTLADIVTPNMKVKEVYAKLLRPLVQKPTSQKTTEKLLANDDINWQEVYMIPRKVSISSSIRIFQYKILNNILYLNRKISKFDLGVSHLCSLCLKEREDILHLFCQCDKTQILWETLSNKVAGFLSLPKLEPELAILGKWNLNTNEKVLINHIVLLFKRFIFDNRSNRHKIHILALLNYFKTVEKVEQKIAYHKDKLKLHFEKWDPIRHIL